MIGSCVFMIGSCVFMIGSCVFMIEFCVVIGFCALDIASVTNADHFIVLLVVSTWLCVHIHFIILEAVLKPIGY